MSILFVQMGTFDYILAFEHRTLCFLPRIFISGSSLSYCVCLFRFTVLLNDLMLNTKKRLVYVHGEN